MPYQKFLRHLQFERRYSTHTLTSYQTDLEQFFEFLDKTYQVKDVKEITHFYVRSWIVSLIEFKIGTRSINRKITALKSFFKFQMRDRIITKDPMTKIVSPKISKKLPAFVDKDKMDDLLDKTEFEDGFSGLRNKLIIEFLYHTGVRLSELINLRETDIDLDNLTIKVKGKRNKERLIPISQPLVKMIKQYRQEKFKIADVSKLKENIFFINDDGNKLYPKFVYRLVRKKLNEVTTLNRKSPHVLRHTFATQLLNNGAEINAVKELLGHTSLASTQVYTHNTIEKLKNVHKQAHPKA